MIQCSSYGSVNDKKKTVDTLYNLYNICSYLCYLSYKSWTNLLTFIKHEEKIVQLKLSQ